MSMRNTKKELLEMMNEFEDLYHMNFIRKKELERELYEEAKENKKLKKVLLTKDLNECKSCMRWFKKDYFCRSNIANAVSLEECGDCWGRKLCIAEDAKEYERGYNAFSSDEENEE